MNDIDDFSLLVQLSRRELTHVLESIPGKKDLVVEHSLMRPLDRITSMSVLAEHGCPRVQELRLDGNVLWEPALPERVFLCRPNVAIVRKLAELIRADPSRVYQVVFVDKRRNICELELEKYGVRGFVAFHELNLYGVPLESDLLSLELSAPSLRTSLNQAPAVARVLWQVQCLYGLIPVTYGVGRQAAALEQSMRQLFAEHGEPPATADRPISHLLVFDRFADLPSVLLTGLTYESMLNDNFQYSCGKVIFGEQVEGKLKNKNNKLKSRVFALNNSDVIFSAVRNKHMTQVFPFLSSKAKALQVSYDKASAMSKVEEVKTFVSNELKSLRDQHKLLEVHICACEAVLEANRGAGERFAVEHALVRGDYDAAAVFHFLEVQMCRQQPPWQVLQLLCLWAVVADGLPVRYFSELRALFLHAYGHEYLSVLFHLGQAGLLFEASSAVARRHPDAPHFGTCARHLAAGPRPGADGGPGYVFSDAYTPLVVRLLEALLAEGWAGAGVRRALPDTPLLCSDPALPRPDNRIKTAILVCFPAGVSYAEIAALRRFAQDRSFRIIIMTSHVISRTEFLKNFTDHE